MEIAKTSPSPRAARAHALKNCLAVVHAVNRLLESEVSERSRERLARSEEAVGRMLAIVREELSADRRPAAARAPGYVSAEEVLRDVVARVEDRAQAGRVELFAHAGTGGVVGDGPELTEAFANLVLNAIEATPAGGAVLVATHELSDGSQVWAVRDTGPGMPEHVRQRLGTPFVTSRKGGSGVGFALARQIVEQHGGQLHVRTIEGSGTLVSMRLPSLAPDALAEDQPRAASGF
jgi:two-component system phosphate regulon sensor histidine kinase PhoR